MGFPGRGKRAGRQVVNAGDPLTRAVITKFQRHGTDRTLDRGPDQGQHTFICARVFTGPPPHLVSAPLWEQTRRGEDDSGT